MKATLLLSFGTERGNWCTGQKRTALVSNSFAHPLQNNTKTPQKLWACNRLLIFDLKHFRVNLPY
jgi:hypothetical protein